MSSKDLIEDLRFAKKFDTRVFMQTLRYFVADKGQLLLGVVLLLGSAFMALMEPKILGHLIDGGLVQRNENKIVIWISVFALAQLLRFLLAISQGIVFANMTQKILLGIRLELLKKYHRCKVKMFDENPVGRLSIRITNDVASLAEMFSEGLVAIFGNIVIVCGVIFMMYSIHWKLALLVSSVFPILAILSYIFSIRLKQVYADAREKLSKLNAFLAENILGMKVTQLFQRQERQTKKYLELSRQVTEANVRSVKVFAIFHPSITWAQGLATAAVLFFGAKYVGALDMSIGSFSAFVVYVGLIFDPIRQLTDRWNVVLSGLASAERVFAMMNEPEEKNDGSSGQIKTAKLKLKGDIEFRNVTFSYKKGDSDHVLKPVLKNVNFKIQACEKVGIIGQTGSGKTTLISLIFRFYEIDEGQILIDGKDIRDYDLGQLRSAFGLIQQDVFLFSGSILDNLNLFRNNLAISEAATVQFKKFSERSLDERGSNMSQGERQLLSFYRTLAQDPSVFILDEATSNMDSFAEHRIEEELLKVAKEKTRLVIAHRLSTIVDADRILVLKSGELIEQGTHHDLLKQNGYYSKLYAYHQASELNRVNAGNA